jgi:phosphate transport system permease protein
MSDLVPIAVLLALLAFGYQYGLRRSRSVARASGERLHSLPTHYGVWVALWCGVPSLVVLIGWLLAEPAFLDAVALAELPPALIAQPGFDMAAALVRIEAIAAGYGVPDEPAPYELAAAERLAQFRSMGRLAAVAIMAAAGAAGLFSARSRLFPSLRARNRVELVVRGALALCSAVAVLTTLGIVVSMLGEAMRFFTFVSPLEFFFGTVWNPRFTTVGTDAGGFGMLPLLWGTIMVAAIAMAVALPVGLMSAIYLAEYAPQRLRSVAKPAIEVLAGIPTIVYGFFALIFVGPFFAETGALVGLDIRATSAFTAGVVMGVMIIPFISSLSDDIITQVPRSMRDGSLAMGATHSETIRRVILPAALPGIVGAFLLAVSRAIGETMIVVLAAGNSPVLHANPFEAISTVTVTIVNQLTGDIDFESPQSLVAFALGLTLFVMTLCLNVLAIHIVRKYREQYE